MAYAEQGIRRYGFHGLSYEYLRSQLRRLTPHAQHKVVMAHLGNGASLCAMHQGNSVATTMGFSAVEGLMMGTRSGAIDPGVLLHLLEEGHSAADLTQLLYKKSGLLGISGLAADMRTLRKSQQASARLAIDMFTHRVVREAGAMTACLQGLDVLVFTGGIGEHDALLRRDVCSCLSYLNIVMDEEKNTQATGEQIMRIDAVGSRVEVWVIPTDEGRMAALSACNLLQAKHQSA
jgi:acetate kinase